MYVRMNIVCVIAVVSLLLLFVAQADAQCNWYQYGYVWWSNPSSWPSNTVPADGSDVVIPPGYSIVYDIAQPHFFNSITVSAGATFLFDNGKNILLQTKYIWIQPGGAFKVGTAACPYTYKANIVLTGPRDNVTSIGGFGNKGIIVGGDIAFYGVPPQPTWTKITSTVYKGGNTFTVQDDLVNWKVGDTIALASTDYYQELTEQFQISAISGRTITVSGNFSYMHWGANNEFAEVGSITRNIVIQGDSSSDASQYGGHVLLYGNATGKMLGVEFTRMGQRNVIGRYPFHFHIMGNQVGRGHFISECAFHHNYQRCFTIHGTSGILARNNVGYNVTGHCYFFEEGSETMNYLDHNLGMVANEGQLIRTDGRASIFWITNPNNTIVNNAAVGGHFGFWYSLPVSPLGLTASQTWILPRSTQMGLFTKNVAHSASESGIHFDEGPNPDGTTTICEYIATVNPLATVKEQIRTTITNCTSYKNRQYGLWMRGSNLTVDNFLLMDNGIGVNLAAGGNLLSNSVIIGETPNFGTPLFTQWFDDLGRSRPRLWQTNFAIHGLEFYDNGGNQYAKNVTFVNFTSDNVRLAGAVGMLQHGPYTLPPNVVVTQSTLVNTNAFMMEPNVFQNDGPKHVVIQDADGSLTGSYGSYIVSNNSLLTYSSDCAVHPEWMGFYLCQRNSDGYSNIGIENKDLPNTNFADSLTSLFRGSFVPFGQPGSVDYITGNDGRKTIRYLYGANVPSRHGYVLQFPHPTPPSIKVNLRFAATGEWVVVALSYPNTASFTITRGYYQVPLTRASSVDGVSITSYYYDPIDQYLYVMYIEDNGLMINAAGFPMNSWGASYVEIKASCGNNCVVSGTRPIPPALVDREDKYQAIMKGCTAGVSNSYEGTAFLNYNTQTKRLSYMIYHNIPDATSATIQDLNTGLVYDLLIPQAPIKGAFALSWTRHNQLWNGNWSVTITGANSQQTIKGFFGCVGTCSVPPMISGADPCATIPGEVVLYNETLNSDGGWIDWSFGASRIFNYTADKQCGQKSLLVNYAGYGCLDLNVGLGSCAPGQCTAYWQKPWVNVTNYAYLQFNIKSPTGPMRTSLSITAQDQTGGRIGTVPISFPYVSNYVIENGWTRVKVPLKDIGFKGTELIGTFGIQVASVTNTLTLIYDDIKLVPAYTDPMTKPPTGSVKYFTGATC